MHRFADHPICHQLKQYSGADLQNNGESRIRSNPQNNKQKEEKARSAAFNPTWERERKTRSTSRCTGSQITSTPVNWTEISELIGGRRVRAKLRVLALFFSLPVLFFIKEIDSRDDILFFIKEIDSQDDWCYKGKDPWSMYSVYHLHKGTWEKCAITTIKIYTFNKFHVTVPACISYKTWLYVDNKVEQFGAGTSGWTVSVST